MNNRDWEIFGREICRNVQDAIDSRDFSRLSQTINDTVYGAADEISRNVKNAVNSQNHRTSYTKNHNPRYTNYRKETYRDNPRQSYQGYTMNHPQRYKNSPVGYNVQLYSSSTPSVVGGTILTVGGVCTGVFSALMTFVSLFFVAVDPVYGMAIKGTATGFFGILLLASVIAASAGVKMLGRARRFKKYVKELGYKEYGNIKELAQRVKKSPKYVVKDLEKMIRKGWFRQGHLDTGKTCLITSNEAFEQYTELEQQRKEYEEQSAKAAKEAELKKKAAEEAAAKLSPEVREVIREGEEYVRKIRECNDAIPGEEISEKIYRIEKVVDRIFDRVEQHPESVSDLHRLMDYYLPTTVKLLKAYESLDAEPVQGENIISSKQEIEKTLDTLNIAFAKLLDSLFEETAWDVSSDISVLNTMLAQEGLTGDGLKK